MNFARDILPVLLAGGGLAAGAMFGKNAQQPSGPLNNDQQLKAGLTQKEIDQNNQIMDRMRRGAPASPMAMGPQMPGNPLAGSAPIAHPAFISPSQAFQMPQNLQGGQQPPLLAAGAGPQPMMAQQWAYPNSMQALLKTPQAPQQWANPATINYGLLGNSRVG
jgi:hypothetical protein